MAYVKPTLPAGLLMMVFEDQDGIYDGPFDGRRLSHSGLPDGSWVLPSDGLPRYLRALAQHDDVIVLEDCGRVRVQPVRREAGRLVDCGW